MRQVVRSSGRLLAVSWRQDRAKTLAAALLVLAWAAAGPFVAVALRWLTDAAVAGRTAEAALAGTKPSDQTAFARTRASPSRERSARAPASG